MKRSHLIILILLAVVLGAAAWLLTNRSTTSWQSTSGHRSDRVLNLPINDVARISIKQPDGEVNLAKKGDNWVVAERSDYPANFELISSFIRKVWELKPGQEVKVGPSQLGRLELVEPGKGANSGTLVEFKDAQGKRLGAILFGKKHMRDSPNQSFGPNRSFPAGRYVMPVDGSRQVSLVTDAFQQIENKPERWLDREFIKIEKPVSITCLGTNPEMNWKLERANDSTDWKLADAIPGEQLDQAKAKQLAAGISNVSNFTDVLAPDAKPESTGLDKPVTLTVTTEDGFTYVLKAGKKTREKASEGYPVTISVSADLPSARTPGKDEKPDDKTKLDKEFQTKHETLEKKLAKEKKFEGRPFLISKFTIEQLEKNRGDLLAKATPTPTPTPSVPANVIGAPPVKPAPPVKHKP